MSLLQVAHVSADAILGRDSEGWDLSWGSEYIHRYLLPGLAPSSSILDICSGWGRGSLCFALHGHAVTLLDCDPDRAKELKDYFRLPIGRVDTVTCSTDLLPICFAGQTFDRIVILDGTVHCLKSQNYATIAAACALLAPGGLIYVDGPSTLCDQYGYFKEYCECVEPDTYMDACGCSGEMKLEPFCFFHPGELPLLLLRHGLEIVFQDSAYLEWQQHKSIAIARKP